MLVKNTDVHRSVSILQFRQLPIKTDRINQTCLAIKKIELKKEPVLIPLKKETILLVTPLARLRTTTSSDVSRISILKFGRFV